MKRFIIHFIAILLMINIICINNEVFAEEENTEVVENSAVNTNSYEYFNGIIKDASDIQDRDILKFQEVTVEISEGNYENEEYKTNYIISNKNEGYEREKLNKNDKVIVELTSDESGNVVISIKDIDRSGIIISLIIFMFLAYLLVFAKKSFKSILNILFTSAIFCIVFIHGVTSGHNIVFISIITSILIILCNFIIFLGINKKMLTGFISAFMGQIVTCIISISFFHFAKISAISELFTNNILIDLTKYDFDKFLFAGMDITSVGMCIFISMSIIRYLDEIKSDTEDVYWKKIYVYGMEKGKNIIENLGFSVFLILFGSVICGVFIYNSTGMRILKVINMQDISAILISAISIIIGMVLTVPITSVIYSLLNDKKTIYRTKSENKVDGNRSLKL